MAVFVNSQGKLLVNASGAPVSCTTCPCGGATCGGLSWPASFSVTIAGVDNCGSPCDPCCTQCENFNGTFNLALCYQSGGSDTCDQVLAVGSVCLRYQSTQDCETDPGYTWSWYLDVTDNGGGNFTVTLYFISFDGAVSHYGGAEYSLTDTIADPSSIVLDFVTGSVLCCNWPATVTVNA